MDITAIRNRILTIQEDLNYFDELLRSKARYEVNLWGIREQIALTNDSDSDLQQTEVELSRRILNCQHLLEKTRDKLLKSLGINRT